MEGGDNVGGANNDVGGGASSGAAADPSTPSDGAAAAAGGGVVDNSSAVVEDGNGLTATTQTVHSENGTPVTVKIVKTAAGNRAKRSWIWQVMHEFKPSINGENVICSACKHYLMSWVSDRKRRRMQAIVTETIDVHRLRKMRDLLALDKLAIWRRITGFDRAVDGNDNWFYGHRSLPPTPQEYASLKSELQKLKNAVSMPAETTKTRPWQKTIDFVDGRKGPLPDDTLAVIKRYVEKRSREAAQAQVTVTPVATVQHCSLCPLGPEPSLDACVKLENSEGKMDPELKELESLPAGTGLVTPTQQCPTNEGTWETGRTTAYGFLTRAWVQTKGETFLHPRNA